jgi:predicted DNA-binding transcriptional regulator AlpA
MSNATALETPLAVDATVAARMIGISRAHLWKLSTTGRAPEPIKLGRRCIWRVSELRDWLDAGAPAVDAKRAKAALRQKARELAGLEGGGR